MVVLLLLFQEGKDKEYHYNFSKSRCNSKDMSPIKIFQVKMVSRRLFIMGLEKLWLQEEYQSL